MAPKAAAKPKASPSEPSTPAATSAPDTPTSGESSKKRKHDEVVASSSKQKVTPIRQPKEGVAKVLHAGTSSKATTFIDVYELEARVAAYLSYKDVKDLRRFVVSYYFLWFFRYFFQPFSAKLRKKGALERVRDRYIQPGFDDFPTTAISTVANPCADEKTFDEFRAAAHKELKTYFFNKDKKEFGQDDAVQQKQHLAHVLIYMVATLSKCEETLVVSDEGRQKVLSDWLQQRLQNSIGEKYNKQHPPAAGKAPRSMKVPSMSGETVILPKFETDFEEGPLEKYNRAWNLLKYMQYCVSLTVWPNKFEREDWQISSAIDRTYVPLWMQRDRQALTAPKPAAAELHKALSKITFTIIWKQGGKYKQDLEQHLAAKDDEGITLPAGSTDSTGDPRVHTQPQFRDSIRRDLGCERLEVQLADCRLTIPQVGGEDAYDFDLETANWDKLRKDLQSAFDRGAQGEVKITVRLRPLLVEDEEELFESNEPPPQLAELFTATEDTVVSTDPGEEGDGDDHTNFFAATRAHTAKPSVYVVEPRKRFPGDGDRDDFLHHFNGHNVEHDSRERIAWATEVCDRILHSQSKPVPQVQKRQTKLSKKKQASESLLKKLQDGFDEGRYAAIAGTDDPDGMNTIDAEMRYYSIQGAFTGTKAQTGPMLQPCLTAMGMVEAEKDSEEDNTKYECTLLPNCSRSFYPYQIPAAAFLLKRLLGYIPLPVEHAEKPSVQAALEEIPGQQTFGCLNCDYTGLGKTTETLLALAFIAEFHAETDKKGNPVHKPMLVAVPANAVPQWARDITTYWQCFDLVISYDSEALADTFQEHVVDKSTMIDLPENRSGLSGKRFRHLFDGVTARNSRTILLTSIETHASRFTYKHVEEIPPVPFDPPKYRKKTKEEIFMQEGYTREEYRTKMPKAFLLAVVDEAHGIKNPDTRNFAGIWLADAKYIILVTATPMQNNQGDIVGLINIIWQQLGRIVRDSQECAQFAKDKGNGWRRAFDAVRNGDIAIDDKRRLVLLDPQRVSGLLACGNPTEIMENFHLVDDLITLRRSAASSIQINEQGEMLALRDLIKPHVIKTLQLSRKGADEQLYQWQHRDAAARYVKELKGGADENKPQTTQLQSGSVPIAKKSKKNDHFVYPTVPLRDLDIANASTMLGRFNLTMRKAKHNTLVHEMDYWRHEGIDGEAFVDRLRSLGDRHIDTREDYISVLCDSSPILTEIIRQIRDHVLLGNKLLITEQVPLIAWFWEMACKLLLIPTATMHAGLDQQSRTRLQDDFNKPDTLMILIIMYDVGGQAIDLHRSCSRVFVATPGISFAKVMQAIGRVVRVDQKKKVEALCAFVMNSHSSWRLHKQSSKQMVELATRAYDPEVRELIIELLQEYSNECDEARESEEGKIMLDYLAREETVGQEPPIEGFAGTANDMSATDVAALGNVPPSYLPTKSFPKRQSAQPDRYRPWEYDGPQGKRITDPTVCKKKADEHVKRLFGSAQALRATLRNDTTATDSDGNDTDFDGESALRMDESDKHDEAYKIFTGQLLVDELKEVTFSEELDQLMAKVKLPKDHQYALDDLNDPVILRRGLMLLYKQRMGQNFLINSPSIHINYNLLPTAMKKAAAFAATTTERDAKLVLNKFGKAPTRRADAKSAAQKSQGPVKRIKVASRQSIKAREGLIEDDESDEEDSPTEQPEHNEPPSIPQFNKGKGRAPDIDPEEVEEEFPGHNGVRVHPVFKAFAKMDPFQRLPRVRIEAIFLEKGISPQKIDVLMEDHIFKYREEGFQPLNVMNLLEEMDPTQADFLLSGNETS